MEDNTAKQSEVLARCYCQHLVKSEGYRLNYLTVINYDLGAVDRVKLCPNPVRDVFTSFIKSIIVNIMLMTVY